MTTAVPWTHIPIREIKPGLKNVNVEFMVLEQIGMNQTKDGSNVYVFKIADISGAINFAVIGDNGQFLRPGDICRVYNGFATLFRGALTFYVGKTGELRRVGEFCFPICEEPYMSSLRHPVSDPSAASQPRRDSKDHSHRSSSTSVANVLKKPPHARLQGLQLLAANSGGGNGSSQSRPPSTESPSTSRRSEISAEISSPEIPIPSQRPAFSLDKKGPTGAPA